MCLVVGCYTDTTCAVLIMITYQFQTTVNCDANRPSEVPKCIMNTANGKSDYSNCYETVVEVS